MTSFGHHRFLTSFGIDHDNEFLAHEAPPSLVPPPRVPSPVPYVTTLWPDHHHHHYETCFHDSTIAGLRSVATVRPGPDLLNGIQIVSDRKTLRRLMKNHCVNPPYPFYCKPEDCIINAEKINGTVFLGFETRYTPTTGAFGRGFEELMTGENHRGDPTRIKTFYGVATYALQGSSQGPVGCVIRFEMDAQNPTTGGIIELKCKKKHPKYGLSPDFFTDLWIQMAISRTAEVHIGMRSGGTLEKIEKFSLAEVQSRAKINAKYAGQAFTKLANQLHRIISLVPEGRQAQITTKADGTLSARIVDPTPTSPFPLPMLSSATRAMLSLPPTPPPIPPVPPVPIEVVPPPVVRPGDEELAELKDLLERVVLPLS